jgi:predicted permease
MDDTDGPRRFPMLTFFRDTRHAARQLRKTPGFSITVILALTLGIGATTAIFSLVEGIILRPLPFADPDRLVLLGDHIGNSPRMPVTAREIGIYTRASSAFSSLGGFDTTGYELSGGDAPQQIDGARLNADVFKTLGVQPILGRVFSSQEEESHQLVAVISDRLWLNRFHRDSRVLGRSITLDRKNYTVIGVMPRGFDFPIQVGSLHPMQLWVPLSLTAEDLSDRNAGRWSYHMVARLKDGVSIRQGAEDAERVSRLVMQSFPVNMAAIRIRGDVSQLREFYIADARPLLRSLFLAVLAVLLICCANVAGLMLVRSIRRRRDYAVRLALGARSAVIVRESITEGVLLSGAGGLLGLGLVALALRSVPNVLPQSMPRIDSIAMDPIVAAFAVLLALLTGALCSLAPAFAALKTNPIEGLKESGKSASGTASHAWLRSAFVTLEIAIALLLLNTSCAFVLSYEKMVAVDPGFRPGEVLVGGYQLPVLQYPTRNSVAAFHRAVAEKLGAKPGVTAVGMGNTIPSSGLVNGAAYTIEGEPESQWKLKFSIFAITDGDYFQAMGIPLREGRLFTANDRAGAPPVVIVNQSMAMHCWPGQSATGKRMHVGNPHKGLPWATVVGVVGDTKGGSRDEATGDGWYAPEQQPATLFGNDYKEELAEAAGGFIVLRSSFAPRQMTGTLRQTVAEIDPHLALQPIEPMSAVMASVEAPRRFNTDLISTFALGALLLAITGIYAVVAFSASMRTQEIAIRLALGAQRVNIARLMLISGAKLGLAGCALGLLGSFAAARIVKSFLFGVSPTEPLIYVTGVAIVLLLVLLASALPAARAASSDPMEALRAV